MRNTARMNTFLVEMVIVILFFSLSTAVTLQLFVSAHNKSVQSQETNVAVIKAQEILENVRGTGTEKGFTKLADGTLVLEQQYDKDWNSVQTAPKYIVKMKIKSQKEAAGAMQYSHVDVVKMNNDVEKTIYQLNAQKYEPSKLMNMG